MDTSDHCPEIAPMRERDAEILEQGIRESASTSVTPLLSSPYIEGCDDNDLILDQMPALNLSGDECFIRRDSFGHHQTSISSDLYEQRSLLRDEGCRAVLPSSPSDVLGDDGSTSATPTKTKHREALIEPTSPHFLPTNEEIIRPSSPHFLSSSNEPVSPHFLPREEGIRPLSPYYLSSNGIMESKSAEYLPLDSSTCGVQSYGGGDDRQSAEPSSEEKKGTDDCSSPPTKQCLSGDSPSQQLSATASSCAKLLEGRHSIGTSLAIIREGSEMAYYQIPAVPDLEDASRERAENGLYASKLRSRKSIERQLNEMAQYAEAVGELPPTNVGEISQEIIEGSSDDDYDDDDDDDDDDDEISRETASQTPQTTILPQSPLSKQQTHRKPSAEDNQTPPSSSTSKKSKSKRKLRQQQSTTPTRTFLDHFKDVHSSIKMLLGGLPPCGNHDESEQPPPPFIYRGLCDNPPEITQRGLSRGNYAQLHRKAWLEVSDKYHRYGKNLRCYYKLWESLGHPTNMFFDWLDSKGEAAGQPLPNLAECPRSKLDSDTVLYITNPNVTDRYALTIQQDENGMTYIGDVNGDPINTGDDGWIFVLRDGVVYAAPKITSISKKTKQRFHHSSFFGGKAVASAGILVTNEHGQLTSLYPHSGHYRPGEAHMQRMLFFLQRSGIELSSFEVDMQQIFHVSRKEVPAVKEDSNGEKDATTKKAKKVDSLHLLPATSVACYLAHKALMIGEGVFAQIHKIRRVRAASVREALDAVDGGGRWNAQWVEGGN